MLDVSRFVWNIEPTGAELSDKGPKIEAKKVLLNNNTGVSRKRYFKTETGNKYVAWYT